MCNCGCNRGFFGLDEDTVILLIISRRGGCGCGCEPAPVNDCGCGCGC